MAETREGRPAQVTIAAWLVMAGSVVVVLTAFEQIAGLQSLETREAVEEFLSQAPGDGLGLGVQGALSALRVVTMVAAATATATALLGFQVLRRARVARLVLTVLALPLFVTGVAVGGLVSSMVVGAIVMLWFQPARDWLDGKTPRQVVRAPVRPSAPVPPPTPTGPPPTTAPRAVTGFGDAASSPAAPGLDSPQQAGAEQYAVAPPGATGAPRRRRPNALLWACALTWAGCALAVVAMATSLALVMAAPDLLLDELYRQNPALENEDLTVSVLRSTVAISSAVVLGWSAVATLFAVFAWRGRRWGWTGLLSCACAASVLCLIGAISSPVLLAPLALCAVSAGLLLRPEVRAFVQAPSF